MLKLENYFTFTKMLIWNPIKILFKQKILLDAPYHFHGTLDAFSIVIIVNCFDWFYNWIVYPIKRGKWRNNKASYVSLVYYFV